MSNKKATLLSAVIKITETMNDWNGSFNPKLRKLTSDLWEMRRVTVLELFDDNGAAASHFMEIIPNKPPGMAYDEVRNCGFCRHNTAHMIDEIWIGSEVKRIDPESCACTDCLTGYSIPLDRTTRTELDELLKGNLINASGKTLEEIALMMVNI